MLNPETTPTCTLTRPPDPAIIRSPLPVWLMAVLLALVTTALYWPATNHDFINYDDNLVVTANVHVKNGLTWENVKWAFCNPVAANWHPVTVLSHMLDCQLFGSRPWGHHLTSVLLHALNAALVFVWLRQLTGAPWRSAWVAAMFGLHPLHVESVAWISERKDVLSGLFFILTLLAYGRYAQNKSRVEGRGSSGNFAKLALGSRLWTLDYSLALFFFALGLMSKPMLVTLPFVLLLLDYWPMQRLNRSTISCLLFEKLPFFGLAAAASIVTFVMQKQAGTLVAVVNLPLGARSSNALVSYCRYVGKLFWPTDLAVFYPHPGHWPAELVLLAGGLILGISALLIALRRRYPFLLMGWLWYGGTLVPVIGLVQVGEQAMADRYAYIPSLGILILTSWGAYALTRSWRHQVMVLTAAGCAAIVLCLGLTRQQLGYWQNSETLFRHALAVTKDNYLAHNNLGAALDKKDQIDEAIRQLQEAIRLKPDDADAHNNLGVALDKVGRTDEAINQYQEAIRREPDLAEAHNNLGTALGREGRTNEAIRQFEEAIRLKPEDAETHYNLGTALLKRDRTDEAISQLQEAIHLAPDYASAYNNLGTAFDKKGQADEAIRQFEEAIRWQPDFVEAHYDLGIALVQKGRLTEAIENYEKAIQIQPDCAEAQYSLGQVLASQGKVAEAIAHYQSAIEAKPDFSEPHYSLGEALGLQGKLDEAARQYRKVIEIKPDYANAHGNLAKVLVAQGKLAEAVQEYQRTLELEPHSVLAHFQLGQALQAQHDFAAAGAEYQKALDLGPRQVPVHLSLAWLLATCPEAALRNGSRAVELAEQAKALAGAESPQLLDTLAAAYAETGQFNKAVETAKRALNLFAARNNRSLAEAVQARLKLYEAGVPFRDTGQTASPTRPSRP